MDLNQQEVQATQVFCDSVSAVALTKNPIMHGRTKHIHIKHHFIQKLVVDEEIKLEVCISSYQLADIFTKALPLAKFENIINRLSITS